LTFGDLVQLTPCLLTHGKTISITPRIRPWKVSMTLTTIMETIMDLVIFMFQEAGDMDRNVDIILRILLVVLVLPHSL
jgi:hypothetical protein